MVHQLGSARKLPWCFQKTKYLAENQARLANENRVTHSVGDEINKHRCKHFSSIQWAFGKCSYPLLKSIGNSIFAKSMKIDRFFMFFEAKTFPDRPLDATGQEGPKRVPTGSPGTLREASRCVRATLVPAKVVQGSPKRRPKARKSNQNQPQDGKIKI